MSERENNQTVHSFQDEPAKVSYFFGKGYQDLGNTIKEAWQLNIQSAKQQMEKAKYNGYTSFKGIIFLISAIDIYIFGSAITAVTSALHIAVLFIFFACIYIGFSVIWLIDQIYISVNKIHNVCPHEDCQASFKIPAYVCPNCGAVHYYLYPSKYGILHRTCNCGAKLPTTFFNGRQELDALCPVCEKPLNGDTASRQYAIPVVGGPSVGKTCFINMAVDQMLHQVGPDRGWDIQFLNDNNRKDYEQVMTSMSHGIAPIKTDLQNLKAYELVINLPGEKISRRLNIYDISGERFSSSEDIEDNAAYSYAQGFVFMIDPLSLSDFENEVENKIHVQDYGVSTKDFGDILDMMLMNLQNMFNLKDNQVVNRSLAVVVNKRDVPTLEEKIGDKAIENYLSEHSNESKLNYDSARNTVIRDFLDQYGAGNFVRTAESRFKHVSYFSCSCLGHNSDGSPFKASGVAEPIVWLLSQFDEKVSIN